jgi:glucokinase
VRGLTGNAGEIGHTLVKAGGPVCGCGRRGCLEAFASRTAITRRLLKAIGKGQHSSVAGSLSGKTPRLKSRELANAFQLRDAVVVKEVHRAGRYLGLGLGSLVNVLGPEIVVIGGGVVEALGEPFLEIVKAGADEMILTDPNHQTHFAISSLGDDAGILGASLLAREKFLSKPAAK